MTKIFLDNYGLVTAPYFGKDGYAVIGLSDNGYKCLQKFLESEEFKGTLNTMLGKVTTLETNLDGIKFMMVLDKTSFLYLIGCLNVSVLFMEEPLAITDVCQVVFQQVTLDSYKPNKATDGYHLFSINRDLYKFSYSRPNDKVNSILEELADNGEGKEASCVWHSMKPDATSSNELLMKLSTLDFNMSDSELADAVIASSLPEVVTNPIDASENANPDDVNVSPSENDSNETQESLG